MTRIENVVADMHDADEILHDVARRSRWRLVGELVHGVTADEQSSRH